MTIEEARAALYISMNGYMRRRDKDETVPDASRIQRWRVDSAVRNVMLTVLDKAEAVYANQYEGANVGGDVAAGFRELRHEIEGLGK